MSFNFVIENFTIGGESPDLSPNFIFYRRGFNLGGSGSQPSWKDVILHGVTALTLVNSKAGSLNYLKLFGDTELLPETYIDSVTLEGKCEQNGTPTPTNPVDIVCNNGTISFPKSAVGTVTQSGTPTPDTPVEPVFYQENDMILRAIDTDADSYDSATQTITRKIGYHIFTGTESFGRSTAYGTSLYINNPTTAWGGVNRSKDVLCQYFTGTSSPSNNMPEFTCFFNSSGHFYFRTSEESSNFKAWLAELYANGTPLIVWFVKSTVETESYTPDIYIDGTTETVTDSNGLTATAQMLLSAGDDKDTQEVISGVVTRNIGIKVFDGTESFSVVNNTYRYSLTGLKMNTKMICSHFDGDVSPSVTTSNQPDLTLKNNQSNNNNAYFKYTAKTTVEDFQQWLTDQYNAGTPVIVIFSLVDATTETVSGQFLSKSPVTYSGSITGLTGTVVESPHTTPTPTQPLDINCNNGVVKLKDSELPFGYKRTLGFACNDNVLWQITNFKLRGSDTVRISFSIADACNVFGCYQGTSANDNYDLYVSTSSGAKYLRYGRGTYLSYWSNTNLGKRFDVVFSPNGTSGMPQDSTWSPLTFEAENDLLLGATTTTATSAKLKGNLYGNFEVDNRLKLIPCERISDGSLGYYDTYTGTFYEPTGTPTSLGYDYSALTTVGADGTVETVEVTGKNLFDKSTADANRIYGYFQNSGTVWTYVSSGFSVRIPCKPNTTYTARYNGNSTQAVLGFGSTYRDIIPTESNPYISVSQAIRQNNPTINTPITLTTKASDKWLIVAYNANEPQHSDMADNLQIEIGSTATTYEPYRVLGTATAERLLKVGDYQDIQSVLDGAVTRNVGIKVLDGTEDDYAKRSDYAINYTGLTDRVRGVNIYGMCSHFVCRADNASTAPVGSLLFNVSNNYLHFFTEYGGNVEQFKQWLADQYNAGTPVIIVYPLATATTQTVTAQPLTIQAGTNIVEITQASMDNLELEVSYKAGVEVTVTEIENAQLDNSVEVTVNG